MSRPSRARATLLAAVLAAAPLSGCAFAVKHPAITAGIVGGTLGFSTCKLASDSYGACLAVGGSAAGFLGLVTAAALWLGGDGNSVAIEEQAQPVPQLEDSRPRRRRSPPPDPAAANPSQPPAASAPADAAPADPSASGPVASPPTGPTPAPAGPDPAPAPGHPGNP